MRSAGIDIGSRTIKHAAIENYRLVLARKAVTSHNLLGTAAELMRDTDYDEIAATGYGMHLINIKETIQFS